MGVVLVAAALEVLWGLFVFDWLLLTTFQSTYLERPSVIQSWCLTSDVVLHCFPFNFFALAASLIVACCLPSNLSF